MNELDIFMSNNFDSGALRFFKFLEVLEKLDEEVLFDYYKEMVNDYLDKKRRYRVTVEHGNQDYVRKLMFFMYGKEIGNKVQELRRIKRLQ